MEDSKEKNTSCTKEVEDHSIVPPSTEIACGQCQEKWSCYGENCYYFSKEEKTWNNNKKSCQDLDSSLVKIDDKDEQKFIQPQINYNHGVGLQKKRS
nr:NKG2-D type II integral membrane protein-like [Loxodonta africana]